MPVQPSEHVFMIACHFINEQDGWFIMVILMKDGLFFSPPNDGG